MSGVKNGLSCVALYPTLTVKTPIAVGGGMAVEAYRKTETAVAEALGDGFFGHTVAQVPALVAGIGGVAVGVPLGLVTAPISATKVVLNIDGPSGYSEDRCERALDQFTSTSPVDDIQDVAADLR